MKVAILNKWASNGGAARAALRLFDALKSNGYDVDYLTNDNRLQRSDIYTLDIINKWRKKLNDLVQSEYINNNRTKISNTLFSSTYNGVDFSDCDVARDTEVINLHWVEYFLSAESLLQLVKLNKPIVWTIHDERAFTGGCHYTSGCQGFRERACLNCEQLNSDDLHLPHTDLQVRKEILENSNLTIVSPSQWLAQRAASSFLFKGFPVHVIPNSIENHIFFPVDKGMAKSELGFNDDVVVIMVGAQDNSEIRKGYNDLLLALKKCLLNNMFRILCEQEKIVLISVGSNARLNAIDITSKNYSFVSDDKKLVQIYNAADFYVLPSIEDNLPNATLEAMSCGTPVVAYNTGGIPDVVIHEENGLLVSCGDTEALCESILQMVFDAEMRKLFGVNSVRHIADNFNMTIQAEKYSRLFNDIVASDSNAMANAVDVNIDNIYMPFVAASIEMRERKNKLLIERKRLEQKEKNIKDCKLIEKLRSEKDAVIQNKKHDIEKLRLEKDAVIRDKKHDIEKLKSERDEAIQSKKRDIEKLVKEHKAINDSNNIKIKGITLKLDQASKMLNKLQVDRQVLYDSMEELGCINFLKNPVKKYRAYKAVFNIYIKLKSQ